MTEKRFSHILNKKLIQIFKKDELITLINKLSEIIKNFTKLLKNNISKKKEEISFIDDKTDFSYNIVNNIIKHNYSYGQLKSLGESLIKIREKNNNNQINLLNEEQNLLLFLEQSDKFFKIIINKQKQNIQKNIKIFNPPSANNTYYNYSLPFFKNERQNFLNDMLNNKKRNKSAGNSRNKSLTSNIIMNNIKIQRVNDNNKKNNLTPLIYKPTSSYNFDINNKDIINNHIYNSYNLGISPSKIIVEYQNLSTKIEVMKRHDIINKKTIQNLNKKIENYKKLIEILSKNQLYEEINSKNKQINLLNQEIDKYKKKLEYYSNKYSIKHRNLNENKILENMSDNLDKLETDPHNKTSYSFNFTENIKNYPMILMKEKQIKHLEQEKNKLEKYINEQNKFIIKGNLIKSKLNKNVIEFNDKNKELEIEIHKLNEQLKNEIFKKEELNILIQQQKIKYEYEISKINDKREELSKFLADKNNEIIKLQKELVEKNKEFEEYKLSIKNNIDKTENIIHEKDKIELELNNKINKMKNDYDILYQQNEKRKNEIIELNKTIKQYKDELSKKKEEINKIQIINNNKININNMQKDNELNKLNNEKKTLNNLNNNLNEEIKKIKEENEGLKEFIYKLKEKEEKIIDKYQDQKEKLCFLQKENDIYKQYFLDKNILVPSQDLNKKKIKSEEDDNINILEELNKAKKEINILKKKNEQLFNDLERKKFEEQYHDNFSEGKMVSNYEEEFDLRKMAKGAKDKNRSQDINIDYPGAQQVKEKYRELDFYYNSLEELVKKLLLNCTCTNKNKLYISELCKIVGFEEDVIYKIINNKSKKGINIYGQY